MLSTEFISVTNAVDLQFKDTDFCDTLIYKMMSCGTGRGPDA
jgi:hypothetical protein